MNGEGLLGVRGAVCIVAAWLEVIGLAPKSRKKERGNSLISLSLSSAPIRISTLHAKQTRKERKSPLENKNFLGEGFCLMMHQTMLIG
jgi:hypothetical protein